MGSARRNRRRMWLGASLTGLAVIVGGAYGLASNVGTSLIPPEWLRGREWLVWVVLALLLVTGAAIAVAQFLQGDVADGGNGEGGEPTSVVQNVTLAGKKSSATVTMRDAISTSGPVYTRPVTQNYPAVSAREQAEAVRGPAAMTNLPPRNPAFTGRTELLGLLGRELMLGPVAIRGLGGVGKSQLALEHAHRGRRSGKYEVTWWVRAQTPLTLAQDLASLAPTLDVPIGADQEETVAAVRAALQHRDRWLIVFDNAASQVVRPWLPVGKGDLLITSRDRGWSTLGSQVSVAEFDRNDSLAYLRYRLGRDDPHADSLAVTLGDLPLALAQAAAYLDLHGGLSIAGYLDIYRDREGAGRLLAQGIDGYPYTVATTWLIHFIELAEWQPVALELLQLCAYLNPDEIDLGTFLARPELLEGPLTGRLASAVGSPFGREEALGGLVRTDLVTRLDDERVRIHRLVAEVTRRQLSANDTASTGQNASWARHTVGLVFDLFPKRPWEGPESWPVCRQLAAHVITVVNRAFDAKVVDGKASALLDLVGIYLTVVGDRVGAKAILDLTLDIKEGIFGKDSQEIVDTLNSLGIVQRQLGQLLSARTVLERALAICEAQQPPDDARIARVLNGLTAVYSEQNDLTAALANQQRAVTISEKLYGREDTQFAGALVNLGMVHFKMDHVTEALGNLRQALTIFLSAHENEPHPDVAGALDNIGLVQRRMGDLSAALASHERALGIQESVHGGRDHPETVITLLHLGIVQGRLGDFSAARLTLERALAMFNVLSGQSQEMVGEILLGLAAVHRQTEDIAAARASLERALTIFERIDEARATQVRRLLDDLPPN